MGWAGLGWHSLSMLSMLGMSMLLPPAAAMPLLVEVGTCSLPCLHQQPLAAARMRSHTNKRKALQMKHAKPHALVAAGGVGANDGLGVLELLLNVLDHCTAQHAEQRAQHNTAWAARHSAAAQDHRG